MRSEKKITIHYLPLSYPEIRTLDHLSPIIGNRWISTFLADRVKETTRGLRVEGQNCSFQSRVSRGGIIIDWRSRRRGGAAKEFYPCAKKGKGESVSCPCLHSMFEVTLSSSIHWMYRHEFAPVGERWHRSPLASTKGSFSFHIFLVCAGKQMQSVERISLVS